MKRNIVWFAVFLIIIAAVMRVLRHLGFIDLPPNVAPVAALALFGGVYLPKRYAVILPLGAMLVSDIAIGFYTPAVMVSVYASFIACSLIGFLVRKRQNIGTVVGATLFGSIVFYLTTNGAVWLFGAWYPRTIAGLADAYLAGIPFFRNTVLGDLGFVGVMFGAYEVARYIARQRVPAAVPHP